MFVVVGVMLSGVLLGRLLRKRKLYGLHGLILGMIWLLLFLLGVEVGSNPKIVESLPILGGESMLLMLGSTLGSVLGAWALWKWASKKERGGHEG